MRKLTPEQEDAIRAAYDAGVRAWSLAKQYGVTVRTIYRTIHRAERETHRVELAGYHALYEVGEEGPVQLTPWRAA